MLIPHCLTLAATFVAALLPIPASAHKQFTARL